MDKNSGCLTNETVLIQSVICSKKIKLIAHVNKNLRRVKTDKIQFIPDLSSIKINTTLLKDLIVIQGFIKGSIVIDGKIVKNASLPFQEEINCVGVCPGDELKYTTPVLEGVLPPQVIPCEGGHDDVVLKVILGLQVTAIREKLGTISVTIIGDINEDRCVHSPTPTLVVYEDKEEPDDQECDDIEHEE